MPGCVIKGLVRCSYRALLSLVVLLWLTACGTAGQQAPPTSEVARTASVQRLVETTMVPGSPTPALNISPTIVPTPTNVPTVTVVPTTRLNVTATSMLNPPSVTPLQLVSSVPTATVSSDDWKIYHNVSAAYTVAYPASWTVNERAGGNGTDITTFTPASGSGIAITVGAGGAGTAGNSDLSNMRCTPVTVSGLHGTRCFDTIAFSLSTTLGGAGKQYVIAASGRRLDQRIYQRLVASFTITA